MHHRFLWFAAVAALIELVTSAPLHAQIEVPTDVYSLVLIHADLDDADTTMKMRDVDADGFLDKEEQARLSWSDTSAKHDLNRDGKLTQLEVAVRFASLREENSVKQIDRTVVARAMQMHDSNRNGQIDPEEISSAWPEEPDEIDVDGNGILTVSELTNAFAFRRVIREETGIIGVDQGWAIKIRNRFDRNADGGLNPEEWDNTPMPSDPEDFDENKDKRLSLLEIATMLAKHRLKLGLSAKDQLNARSMISRFDADFSGVVTKEELMPYEQALAPLIEQLKQFDSDKDGDVSLMEIETTLGKRRDEMGYSDRDAANAKVMIQRHDKNVDLRISESELKEEAGGGYLGKVELPQIDRNGDGFINQDELARYLARQK